MEQQVQTDLFLTFVLQYFHRTKCFENRISECREHSEILLHEQPCSFIELRLITKTCNLCTLPLQVVASWNLTDLDEATADRLYAKVKAQTLAGPQPASLKMTYLDEWLQANVQAGSVLVDDPKVRLARPAAP
jgi:hypothetical protein